MNATGPSGGSVVAEVLLTGVGGQGIQLVSRTLALAAVAEGRHAMMLGTYGGTIRGGLTEGAVVIGLGGLRTLPIIPSAWSAFVMSPQFWESIAHRVRPGGPVVFNSDLGSDDWAAQVTATGYQVIPFPADQVALEAGAPLTASFALLGAFAAITGLAGADSLVEAMTDQVPSYRAASIAANEAAIRRGYERAPALTAPAFPDQVVAGQPS